MPERAPYARKVIRGIVVDLATATLLIAATVTRIDAQSARNRAWTDPSPHQIRHIVVAREVQLEVLDWGGNGPPLVFLTGLGNTAHVYDDFAPRFRDQFHVYAITRRGYGTSSAPAGGYDAATRARDIVTVLDSLHIDRAVLAGHSIAGDELSKVGATYPARVRALIYLDAYDYGPARVAAMEPAVASMVRFLPTMTAADSASPAAVTAFTRRSFRYIGAVPESKIRAQYVFRRDGRLVANGPGEKAAAKIIAGTENPNVGRITAPALGIFAVYPNPAAFLSTYSKLDSAQRAQVDRAFLAGVR